jgi:2-keto-4-pentenoate hydratase/2-oxohepta-3-ene-1,7-dioic acid hydratase in catechol pathway
MKLARFQYKGDIHKGIVEGGKIKVEPPSGPSVEFPLSDVRLLPPTIPSKIVAVGLNYRDHAEELNQELPEEPLLFMKPSTTVIGPEDYIVMPPASERVDYEAELGIIIGKQATRVTAESAGEYILGFTCLNDVTARDLQIKDGQWTRAKGFDTFCPIGPWIETEVDPGDLTIELYLNHERKQKSTTDNLIFDVYKLVSFISGVMTLLPGDVIATGTPSGIGPLTAGDEVEVRIQGVGSLVNRVKSLV